MESGWEQEMCMFWRISFLESWGRSTQAPPSFLGDLPPSLAALV